MTVTQLSKTNGVHPRLIALGLINLLRKGLVTVDGSVEDAIADLKHQIATGNWR